MGVSSGPRLPIKNLEIGLYLDFVRNKTIIFFSLEVVNIVNSYYMQYDIQAQKILAPSDKKKKKLLLFQEFFCGKTSTGPHIFYYKLLFLNLYKFMYFEVYP